MRKGESRRLRRTVGAVAPALLAMLAPLAACSASAPDSVTPTPSAPVPGTPRDDCGTFTIGYDPANGHEISAFIVGSLATEELGCDVRYVETTARAAWRLVAEGRADVYLDAYGSSDLQQQLAGPGGPVTVLGPNGVLGGVDLLAPAFMASRGLDTSRDLADARRIGWGRTRPVITTAPELRPLARTFVRSQHIGYAISAPGGNGAAGMSQLLQQASLDDKSSTPNLYLVAGPRQFLGDGAGRAVVDIPESAAEGCQPSPLTTLCSVDNFRYLRIVNSQFAHSDSPAYNLVYAYHLRRAEAVNLLEIVALGGYAAGPVDAASWINTHRDVWRRWLP